MPVNINLKGGATNPNDPAAIGRAVDYLKPRLEKHICPICSQTQWVLPESVFELREFFGGGMRIGGNTKVLPVVVVACQVCGYTIMFNAINIGAIEVKLTK